MHFSPPCNLRLARAARLTLAWVAVSAMPALHAQPAHFSVPTVAVASGVRAAATEFDAVLQPLRQATVTAQVGGNVLALGVKAGARVKRGQLLLRLDDRDLRASVARSDAGVAQADAELRNVELVRKRNRELVRSGFISQAALDQSESQTQAAEATLLQAQAERRLATLNQGHAELKAPFDAMVLATHVEAGDLALPGRALVTLYEPGRLRAVVQLPASRAAGLSGTARVMLADGRSVVPSATELLPGADPVSQTVEWRLVLPVEAAATARPGQMARVRIEAIEAAASDAPARLSVPRQAVLRRGELTAVYVAGAQGFALRAVRSIVTSTWT